MSETSISIKLRELRSRPISDFLFSGMRMFLLRQMINLLLGAVTSGAQRGKDSYLVTSIPKVTNSLRRTSNNYLLK